MSAAAAKLTDVVSDNGGWHGPAKLGREASSESMAKLALDHATHSAELALDHAARCNHPHCSDSQMSPAALNVRPSGPGDLVPLSFFFDTVLRKDYFVRRGQLAEILGGKRHRVFVAELDGVLVGVAILTSGSRLVNALVHPAYRGLGIGAELVDASGAREVRAKIDMSTGDPRGFYERLGFAATGQFNGKGNIELMQKPEARRNGRLRSGRSISKRKQGK